MRHSFYDNPTYRKRQSRIAKRHLTLHPRLNPPITKACSNPTCNLLFQLRRPSDKKIYCSHQCSATVNNSKRPKKSSFCINCNLKLSRSNRKYCSIKCQKNYYYNLYINRWKQGLEHGKRGITTHGLSGHIKRFLKEKFGDKCTICNWNTEHPITGKVPLEIDNIDCNWENNKEENLRLICPNCHSLTSSFRNLNKGKGRAWRLVYLKNHS